MIYKNSEGMFHRVNGPAIEWRDGDYIWCYNGPYHRYYGPARRWGWVSEGEDEYWIFGEMVT